MINKEYAVDGMKKDLFDLYEKISHRLRRWVAYEW